jgi:uncharacterized protein (DUF697 family)/predicted GTPase
MARKKLEEAFADRGQATVLIAGKTGAGKTTLINAVFQGNFGTTGQGNPVTQEAREIKKEGVPLSIIDTRGLEVADYKTTFEELEKVVKMRNQLPDPHQHVHVAWLCIVEDLRRVEEAEVQLAKMLSKYMPVIAVITKARADKAPPDNQSFLTVVESKLPEARKVIRVRAIPEILDEGHVLQPMNLRELVELTMELLPEGQRNAFAASQKVAIDLKVKRARIVVVSAATTAAAVGASPIPFSDVAVLAPVQVGMLAKISSVFGLRLDTAALSTMVASALGVSAATLVGKTIVVNLLKLIPGANIAGSVISGATAATITTALGEAYIRALVYFFEKNPDANPSADEIAEIFKREVSRVPVAI